MPRVRSHNSHDALKDRIHSANTQGNTKDKAEVNAWRASAQEFAGAAFKHLVPMIDEMFDDVVAAVSQNSQSGVAHKSVSILIGQSLTKLLPELERPPKGIEKPRDLLAMYLTKLTKSEYEGFKLKAYILPEQEARTICTPSSGGIEYVHGQSAEVGVKFSIDFDAL